MKYRVLVKKLRNLGCEFVRQAPGSHEIWWNPANHSFTSIPRLSGKDMPKGTVEAILRHLGIEPDDFRQA